MNKKCTYSDEDIWAYFSNGLSREDETKMQEHVYACEDCQKRLNKLRTLDEILDEAEPTEPTKKPQIRKYLIVAVSVAAVAALIFILTPSSSNTNPYPIDELVQPGYGTGDSIRVDSIDNKIDTIY